MATILLTHQCRSRGKKRRKKYHAEVSFEQMPTFCSCNACKQPTKPWTGFRVTIVQNQQNYLYLRLDSSLGKKVQQQIAIFLPPKKRLCIECVFKKIKRANLVLGLRQR